MCEQGSGLVPSRISSGRTSAMLHSLSAKVPQYGTTPADKARDTLASSMSDSLCTSGQTLTPGRTHLRLHMLLRTRVRTRRRSVATGSTGSRSCS